MKARVAGLVPALIQWLVSELTGRHIGDACLPRFGTPSSRPQWSRPHFAGQFDCRLRYPVTLGYVGSGASVFPVGIALNPYVVGNELLDNGAGQSFIHSCNLAEDFVEVVLLKPADFFVNELSIVCRKIMQVIEVRVQLFIAGVKRP